MMQYMNIFNSLDFKMKNPMKDSENVKNVHQKLERIVNSKRPNPEDFRGIIPDSEINYDIKKVSELEQKWKSEINPDAMNAKMIADIAEYIVYKNLGFWVNERATPIMTSKADDYLRGVDLLVESHVQEGGGTQHLGIGMDVALLTEKVSTSETVEKKEKKVRQILKSGILSEARYVPGVPNGLKDLPYTIISISSSHVDELSGSVFREDESVKEKNHILKYIVAYQIVRQLGTYYSVADAQEKEHLAYQYGVANNFANDIFGHLISDLQNNPDIWKKVSTDAGTQEIERFCSELEKEIEHHA